MAYLWVLGVCLIIAGSLGQNLGQNLISLGHKEADGASAADHEIKEKEDLKQEIDKDGHNNNNNNNNKDDADANNNAENHSSTTTAAPVVQKSHTVWRHFGTFIFIFGALFTFAAFGFAAQSLLASLESIQFVSNVLFAKYVHKETITWRMVISTISIVVGNVLVVIFSDHSAYLFTSHDIIYLYVHNKSYHAYLIIAGSLFFITLGIYKYYNHSRLKKGVILWMHSLIEPLCFCASSAIVGSQAVLNSKCMSMLIQVSIRGVQNEFVMPTVWVILVTWIIMVAFWLRRMDMGLAQFPPLFIIPVLQVFFVLFAIICGGVYFEEFLQYGTNAWIGFIIGVTMILVGVYGLAPTELDLIKVVPVDDDTLVEIDQLALIEEGQTNKSISVPKGPMPNANENNQEPKSAMKVSATVGSASASASAADNPPVQSSMSYSSLPSPSSNNNNNQSIEKELYSRSDIDSTAAAVVKSKRKVVKRPSSPQVVDPLTAQTYST